MRIVNSVVVFCMLGCSLLLVPSGCVRTRGCTCLRLLCLRLPLRSLSEQAVPSSIALQAAGRRVAYHTFQHVLDLDINFHLERRTGALSRVLERGMHLLP